MSQIYIIPDKTVKDNYKKVNMKKFDYKVGEKYKTKNGNVVVCDRVYPHSAVVKGEYGKCYYIDNDGVAMTENPDDNVYAYVLASCKPTEFMKTETKTFDHTKPFISKCRRPVEIITFDGRNNTIVGYFENFDQPVVWDKSTGMNKNILFYNWNLINEPDPPVYVPLDADDILPGDVIRRIDRGQVNPYKWLSIISVNNSSIETSSGHYTFIHLKGGFEISHDQGKTWQKCQKLDPNKS